MNSEHSQVTICVKDLYKPIQHPAYNGSNRKDLPSYRFKILSCRHNSRSISPKPGSQNNTTSQRYSKPKLQGLMIQMLLSPNPYSVPIKSYLSSDITPSSIKRPSSSKFTRRFSHSNEDSQSNPRRNISCSLQAQKINISSYAFPKTNPKKFRIQRRKNRKIIPIPKVQYLTGWEV